VRRPLSKSIVTLAIVLFSGCSRTPQEQPYDLLITGGSVLNGDGTAAVSADVAVRTGRIAAVGNLAAAQAVRRIDASGLVVAPGFIDMHNHSDYTVLLEPKAESMIRQGVTTMVLGESRSAGPVKPGSTDIQRGDGVPVDWTTLGGYFAKLESQHMAANIASYVGEEQVWTYVKGYGQSAATPEEI
jgi:N-acyl-D-amino-acid deacylase